MREQVIHIVETYIDAVRRNDASALPLHPDAICEFPTNTYRGAVSFRQGLDQFAQIVKQIGEAVPPLLGRAIAQAILDQS